MWHCKNCRCTDHGATSRATCSSPNSVDFCLLSPDASSSTYRQHVCGEASTLSQHYRCAGEYWSHTTCHGSTALTYQSGFGERPALESTLVRSTPDVHQWSGILALILLNSWLSARGHAVFTRAMWCVPVAIQLTNLNWKGCLSSWILNVVLIRSCFELLLFTWRELVDH